MGLASTFSVTSPLRFEGLVRHKDTLRLFDDEPEYNEGLGPEFRKWLKKTYKVTDKDIAYSGCETKASKCDNLLYRDKNPVADLGDLLHNYFSQKKGCYDIDFDETAEHAGYGDGNWYVTKLDCEKISDYKPTPHSKPYGRHA